MSHSDRVRGRALAYGHDHALLHTRARMLEADGYRTDLVFERGDAISALSQDPPYDVFVVCHSVPEPDRSRVVASVKNMPAPVPLYLMNGPDSPETFLRTVAQPETSSA